MSNGLSLNNNLYNQNIPPETAKKMQSQENFGALDKKQLQQDAVQLSNKTVNDIKENSKENFVYRGLRHLGVKDPKKLLKSLALTVGTVTTLAVLGNKTSSKMADLGISLDKSLQSKEWFQTLTKKSTSAKEAINNKLFKEEGNAIQRFLFETKDALTHKAAKPKCQMGRGYGRGFVSIFSLTPVDTLQKSLAGKSVEEAASALENIVGKDKAKEFAEQILSQNGKSIVDNREFCQNFSNAIREKFNCADNKAFKGVLDEIQQGKHGEIFTNVNMSEKGLMGIVNSWWPVNFINSGISKITGKPANFCRGNLGDSLIKFNVVNGSLADTAAGKLVQKSILVPTESISNFVNDKSGLGLFLGISYLSTFNNMQDAPKGKKIGTLADDFVGTIGSIAIATPLAFKSVYGLASLRNVGRNAEGEIVKKGLGYKLTRGIGSFFGVGLNNKEATSALGKAGNKIKGFGGGAMRFALLFLVLTPFFQKPIKAAINKIFGKPYDEAEAKKEQEQEAKANQIIPELGISMKDLSQKIQAHPEVAQNLQSDPELLQIVDKNPKALLELLDGKQTNDVKQRYKNGAESVENKNVQQNKQTQTAQNTSQSQQLKQNTAPQKQTFLNTQQMQGAQKQINPNGAILTPVNQQIAKNSVSKTQEQDENVDSATYIPSSAGVQSTSSIGQETNSEYDKIMANADKVYEKAMKTYNM